MLPTRITKFTSNSPLLEALNERNKIQLKMNRRNDFEICGKNVMKSTPTMLASKFPFNFFPMIFITNFKRFYENIFATFTGQYNIVC